MLGGYVKLDSLQQLWPRRKRVCICSTYMYLCILDLVEDDGESDSEGEDGGRKDRPQHNRQRQGIHSPFLPYT